MKHIYLIRHGDKFTTPPDPGLNSTGTQQAKETALALSRFPITHIVSSPLRRAQETAKPIEQSVHIPITTDERLYERMNFGDVENQSFEDFLSEWVKSTWERDYQPSNGISSAENGRRLKQVILDHPDDSHIVLVTHGGTVADFLRNVLPVESLAPIVATFGDREDFDIKNCSITQLTYDGTNFKLVTLNDVKHLSIVS